MESTRRRPSSRRQLVIVIVVFLAGIALTPAAVSAATDVDPATQRTEFRVDGPPVVVGTPVCDASGAPCLFPGSRTVTFSGDWEGTAVVSGSVSLRGTGFAGSAVWLFSGTVEGCGTGTLHLSVREVGSVTGGGSATGRWVVQKGFGSGELSDVTGGGRGSGSTAAGSEIQGKVRC
jgi:hypothetical protein